MSATVTTRPIERAFIRITGDPSVGIPHAHFEMTLHVDHADWDALQLATLRSNIAALYEMAHGEPATVTFDFEITDT